MFSSCFGGPRRHPRSDEEEPLLPQYDDETSLQRELHQKLHTYQMLRALSQGFMPSNEQAIVNLRTLLASAFLNPENNQLSDSGRALIHYTKQWIKQLIRLLEHKNSKDQIQDFIWFLSKARVSIDMAHVVERAGKAKSKADTAAAYQSLQTVGSLLLTNSDFRLFLSDLNVVAREVFKDTAFALADASMEAGKRLEPAPKEKEAIKQPGNDVELNSSQKGLEEQVDEVSDVLKASASKVLDEAGSSIADKLEGEEKNTMLNRLKEAVMKLRKRQDYTDSVSTLSLLLKRYAMVYSRIVRDTLEAADDDIDRNPEVDKAMHNFWLFINSFGDAREWEGLETSFNMLMDHSREDPDFEALVNELGRATQEMMTDPSFFDHAEQRFQELRDKSRLLTSSSTLRDDVDALLAKIQSTFQSVLRDRDVASLLQTSKTLLKILSPAHEYTNTDLVADSVNVFVPLLIQSINYIPIPRLEISTPQIDLLLENLILEPGATINHTSFFPYKLRIETLNDIQIRKGKFRTAAAMNTIVRISVSGLSIRAEEVGFWLRAHSGLLRWADEGIASFELDERGLDIEIDVEIGKDRVEKMVSLRGIRVHIHKLNWKLRQSKFSFLSWIFKPFVRPIIRKTLEQQIANGIGESLQFANRELVFARERLRATRIADPDDLKTFFRAILARLVPPDDPDLYTRVGVADPGKGVFDGVYAPGSVVKLWNEEALQAKQRIWENEEAGWRNHVFDVHATMLG